MCARMNGSCSCREILSLLSTRGTPGVIGLDLKPLTLAGEYGLNPNGSTRPRWELPRELPFGLDRPLPPSISDILDTNDAPLLLLPASVRPVPLK